MPNGYISTEQATVARSPLTGQFEYAAKGSEAERSSTAG